MRKSYKIAFLFVMLFICQSIVNASELNHEIFYINKYGVELTKEEYNFLTDFYWNGCQDLMTKENYAKFIESNIMNGDIDSVTLEPISLYSASISTPKKTLKISRSCTDNCAISVTATWKTTPVTKSYDVIGAYLENTSLVTDPVTTTASSTKSYYSDDIVQYIDGFGVSIKLPSSGSNFIVNQSYRVQRRGKIYASYQHATKAISSENSKRFSISSVGYGNVFKFSGPAVDIYDRMNGVNLALN